jgi:hypothetical protein
MMSVDMPRTDAEKLKAKLVAAEFMQDVTNDRTARLKCCYCLGLDYLLQAVLF